MMISRKEGQEDSFNGAGHVLETSVWLDPIPFSAKDVEDLGAAFDPMLCDNVLNQSKIGLSDGPFPDGNGKYFHSISERNQRRQQKIYPVKEGALWEI